MRQGEMVKDGGAIYRVFREDLWEEVAFEQNQW